METKINREIRSVLEKFGDKYFIDDNVNKSKVIQDLDMYDKPLLGEFIHNETIKENFTIDIEGNIVLQTNKLIELFEADEYWQDSYTKFSKKIGLTVNGKFIDESTDVVLDFPYKDTVLKASMSKEDTDKDDLKPDEIFLNEVIAKEEIDVLLDKKILVNAKKYSQDGVEEIDNFNEDDNLIIKGNNLLALHTLKEKYAGKVKLIYIDPPYNTGSDSFKYNDKFNHSTWLTFMKNRLEIASNLLSNNGCIWIQLDDNEIAHAKVLCDEIFGERNFINLITLKTKTAGVSGSSLGKSFIDSSEYLLVYAKDKEVFRMNNITINYPLMKVIDDYKKQGISWKYTTVFVELGEREYLTKTKDGSNNDILVYTHKNYVRKSINELMKEENLTEEEVYEKYIDRICTSENAQTSIRQRVQEVTGNEDELISIDYVPVSGRNKGKLTTLYFIGSKKRLVSWLNVLCYKENNKIYKKERVSTIWDHINWNNVNKEGNVNFPSGQKPEELIKLILESNTNENDIVLDFFMGSATTQAVAHKMKRQYIGIEQMDYIQDMSVFRLQEVVKGDQSGISKSVNWEGGGTFVYAELMEKNRGFLKTIRDAKDQSHLRRVLDFMLEEAEIDFKVDLEKVKESLHELSLDDQKRTLIKIIDKNQLYYNYSEIDDDNVRDLISDNDYAFNKSFYEGRGE